MGIRINIAKLNGITVPIGLRIVSSSRGIFIHVKNTRKNLLVYTNISKNNVSILHHHGMLCQLKHHINTRSERLQLLSDSAYKMEYIDTIKNLQLLYNTLNVHFRKEKIQKILKNL